MNHLKIFLGGRCIYFWLWICFFVVCNAMISFSCSNFNYDEKNRRRKPCLNLINITRFRGLGRMEVLETPTGLSHKILKHIQGRQTEDNFTLAASNTGVLFSYLCIYVFIYFNCEKSHLHFDSLPMSRTEGQPCQVCFYRLHTCLSIMFFYFFFNTYLPSVHLEVLYSAGV